MSSSILAGVGMEMGVGMEVGVVPRLLQWVGDVSGSLGCVFLMDKGYFIWKSLPLMALTFLLEITASIRAQRKRMPCD